MSRVRARRGDLAPPQETIEKLEKMVNDGNFYEAQQMYKSMSARYTAAEKYSQALDILQSGALLQLKHGQVTCGAELAVLYVETLIKGNHPYSNETLGSSQYCIKLVPVHGMNCGRNAGGCSRCNYAKIMGSRLALLAPGRSICGWLLSISVV